MKLFVAYLGGKMKQKRIGEDHETVMLVAENQEEAKVKARSKWQGEGAAHLDMLIELGVVDGYKINLEKVPEQDTLKMDDDWEKLNPDLV